MRSKKKLGETSQRSQSARLESRARIQIRHKSRAERIRDKNVVFPESSQDKIVFITNKYGNGFRKENLQSYGIPSHIGVERMLTQVNRVCYEEWKKFHDELERIPLTNVEKAAYVGLFLVLIFFVIYQSLVDNQKTAGFNILNYLLISLILAILVKALRVCTASRVEIDPDTGMVWAIQQKLMEFNQKQQEYYGQKTRFQWTCHSQCLWIAISF